MRWHIGRPARLGWAWFPLEGRCAPGRIRISIFGITLFLCPALFATESLPLDQLQHKSWTTIDGAPSHALFLAQGGDGLLWISAVDGLYRFDGAKFSSFRLPEGIAPTANNAYLLRASSSGALFAGSFYEGIVTIDHVGIRAFGVRDGLPHAPISFLTEGPDHRMWCAAGGHLLRLDGNRWTVPEDGANLPQGVADTLLFDHTGTLWVATNTGKLYFLPAGRHSFQISHESWDPSLGIVGLLEGPGGSLWLGLQNLKGQQSIIRELNVEGHPAMDPTRLEFPYSIWDLHFDRTDALWVTGQGIRRITFSRDRDPLSGLQGLHVSRDETIAAGLSSTATKYLCEDNEGDIWVSTLRGVERFRTPALVAVAPPATELAASPDVAIGSKGRVWVRAGEERISAFEGNRIAGEGPDAKACFEMFEDRDGALWYSDQKELWRFDHGHLSKVAVPPALSVRRLMQIAQLPGGPLLFLFDGLGLWKWARGEWNVLSPSAQSEGQITAILPQTARTVWLGYASGRVATLNFESGTISVKAMGQSTLGAVYAFLETHFGVLISGNRGVAILRHKLFERLTIKGDVDVVGVSGMIQSFDGDLWLNSEHGVVHVSNSDLLRALQGDTLGPISAEVLSEPEIRGPARLLHDLPTVARDASGRLWFNTSDTIVFIDPEHIARNTVAPVLTISGISSDGHLISRPFSIPRGSHTIRIEYFGSNLTAPEKVRYRYKLDGVDDDWQDVGSRTEAVYTRLRPGRYSFQVVATNGENVWSRSNEIGFTVLPMFYETPWFVALCCCALIAMAVLAYRMRVQIIASRLRDRAEERANERIRIARDLHDTLLQGFQGLMLSFHVAAQSVPNDSSARRMLDGALLKADRLVVEGRDRVGRLRSESLEGVSLPDALRALGEELNTRHALEFEVRILQTEIEIEPHVKDELFCIAREAITNSFRHANATEIGAVVDYERRALSMTCHDNGCGIDQETNVPPPESCHYGVVGMIERARRIGASYRCDSSPGLGTKVVIRLPANRAYVQSGRISAWLRLLHKVDAIES